MSIMLNKADGHQIRNASGPSPYFRGVYKNYGRYAWNIKFYGFQSNEEIESAQDWALGEHVMLSTHERGFEQISELLGRPIESYTAGRSGGWLVVGTELTEEELAIVDQHVASCMAGLPEFLKEERGRKAEEEAEGQREGTENRSKLKADTRVAEACALIKAVAGCDAVLVMHGIGIDLDTGAPEEESA